MSVDGRELATLDFANLIGGPLNAIVEAQVKSAITTANFIKEVGFDDEGNAVHARFAYEREGPDGRLQEYTLSVPLLTMLPIPYLMIDEAEIEFNARITSTRERSTARRSDSNIAIGGSGSAWATRASLQAKTSTQRRSRSSEKEQRSFDMRVLVRVRGADVPPGTERLLLALENSIEERGGAMGRISGAVERVDPAARELTLSSVRGIGAGWTIALNGQALGAVTAVDASRRTITVTNEPSGVAVAGDTFEATPPASRDERS